jgi:hypothetical protein
MKSNQEKSNTTESGLEKGSRWYRNFNIAVGSVALVGAGAIAAPAAAGLTAYAGFNFVQAGFGEAGRRWAKKRKKQKES